MSNYCIQSLIKKELHPYGLTVTLNQSEYEYSTYPDSLLYSSVGYINSNSEIQKQIDTRTRFVVSKFRLGLNKWMGQLFQTSNITRSMYQYQIPILHYTIELMNKDKRINLVSNRKGSYHLCPLHFHGIMFVNDKINDRFQRYVGNDKLMDFSERFNGSEIKPLTDVHNWNSYINKKNNSYYYPYSDFYPIAYKTNPNEFLTHS